jgi:flagellar biosynthesis anti-sigma factor FlgM
MKINTNSPSTTQLQQSEATKVQSDEVSPRGSGKSAPLSGREDSVSVNFSTRAADVKKIKDMVNAETVDEAKVAHFQNLIDSGKYKVDSSAVADRLLDEHLKMDI